MAWDALRSFGTMGISFVSNIILARLLLPDDFGTLGVIMAFVTFSSAFVDGGLASSLIQRGNPEKDDYSSVFFFNVGIAVLFYLFIFALSPSIASFFDSDVLVPALRATGIVILTDALSIVHITRLQVSLQFKKRSFYYLIATAIGAGMGIALALMGFGLWSLVVKTLTTSIVLCIIVWSSTSWKPGLVFSLKRVKALFSFGGYMFLSTLIEYLYAFIQPMIIGRFFLMEQLGYFSQARKIEEIPANGMVSVINTVTFPVYSKLKDDLTLLVIGARKTLKALFFIAAPIMAILILLADPIIVSLLGQKWQSAAPFLQVLCIAGLFRIPSGINMNLIQSIGKSKAFMFVQIVKRCFGLICIIVGVFGGIMGLMWGFAVAGVIFFAVDSFMCGKFLGYGTFKQISDMLPYAVLALISSIVTYIILYFFIGSLKPLLICCIIIPVFMLVYCGLSYVFKVDALRYITEILAERKALKRV